MQLLTSSLLQLSIITYINTAIFQLSIITVLAIRTHTELQKVSYNTGSLKLRVINLKKYCVGDSNNQGN